MIPKDWVARPGMAALILASTAWTGCAGAIPKSETEATAASAAGKGQPQALEGTVHRLESRLEALEAKLSMLNEKFDVVVMRQDAPVKAQAVVAHPSDSSGLGAPVDRGDAVSQFRQAMVNFRASRFPEAILGFSAFVEKFPDHPMAGAAQFHVGESYLRQKEWTLAVQEFQRVLTTYDRSSHVAQTLRQLAVAEEQLKKGAEAARHRQLLLSLFPQSPAAAGVADQALKAPPVTEARAEIPAASPAVAPAPKNEPAVIESRKMPASVEPTNLDAPPPTLPAHPEH